MNSSHSIFSTLGRIYKILPKTYRRKSILLTLAILVNSLFEIVGLAAILPVLAAILKKGFVEQQPILHALYQQLAFNDPKHFIVAMCLMILLFILIKNLFGVWVQTKQAHFSWNLHESISSQVFENAFKRGYLFFSQNNSNRILNRINGIPQQFAQQMLINVFQLINEFLILILIIGSLLVYDYLILLLLGGIVLPVFVFFYQTTKKRIASYGTRLNELGPEIVKPVYEVVFGYVDVVVNGIFPNFKKEYLSKIKEAKSLRITVLIIQNIPNRLIETCVILAVLIILLYGLFQLQETDKILTLMSIFGLAAYRTIPSINRLILAVMNIKNFHYTLDYLEDYLNTSSTEKNTTPILFKEKLCVKNLSFSYPDANNPVLKNISIEIKKGESLGIMGSSGSGKTTLMNILLGFLQPTSGHFSIDEILVDNTNREIWQQKCGYVRQDVFLIDGSLEDNIAFGVPKSDVDPIRLEAAIQKAQLSTLLDTLPSGKDTNIGERGAKISGGQRQRVGIARALYHGAEILFFDEATSALDSTTEEEITESIRSLHESHLTMVIIAHRESTLKYCDSIFRLA
ncbi:hypothetical protein BFP72_14920 [Reichenbachiella sp. 5M10]|uniref:ATP-binding cassette domain-containing protein n=1 Tax=Reichenbachiella sp. 5M10 TaxID=1889772 RepID=UPI000C14F3DF|nr:ABC transporter ATP-binding protein [Reichenbachiella sp. 5M10]PIB36601.1 hypothetical protein BFP72_14920 [Reichenbachiella sp. 5M10]